MQLLMDRYWPDALAGDKKAAELWRKLGVDLRVLTGWQAPASSGFHLSVNVAQVTTGSAKLEELLNNLMALAAEQGEIFAQTSLAYLYVRGEGVPKDLALAHMWLNLAAAQGQPVAKVGLDRLASKMTSGQISETRRLARGWKPTK